MFCKIYIQGNGQVQRRAVLDQSERLQRSHPKHLAVGRVANGSVSVSTLMVPNFLILWKVNWTSQRWQMFKSMSGWTWTVFFVPLDVNHNCYTLYWSSRLSHWHMLQCSLTTPPSKVGARTNYSTSIIEGFPKSKLKMPRVWIHFRLLRTHHPLYFTCTSVHEGFLS